MQLKAGPANFERKEGVEWGSAKLCVRVGYEK